MVLNALPDDRDLVAWLQGSQRCRKVQIARYEDLEPLAVLDPYRRLDCEGLVQYTSRTAIEGLGNLGPVQGGGVELILAGIDACIGRASTEDAEQCRGAEDRARSAYRPRR